MRFSNFVLMFMGIGLCLAVIIFINVDITQRVNTENIEYANKLSSACFDAARTMNTENIEKYGKVWNDFDDLESTLEVFYNSLVYSFNWDNAGRVDEMALYTPVVCLIDIDGYYISHNVVFDATGLVSIPNDAIFRNALTSINAWSKSFGGVVVRFFLNDKVEVYWLDGIKYEGNRKDVYEALLEEYPSALELSRVAFLSDDTLFYQIKNECIVREINKTCEYYINRHNVVGDNYEMKYTFEMPEIAGEDWSRLLVNPTVISFLQGYSEKADNKLLNVYALSGGELVKNYHYFIENDTYHCIEADPDVHQAERVVTTTYDSEGITKIFRTTYIEYTYHGQVIDRVYNTQTECAKRGALPCTCVYSF